MKAIANRVKHPQRSTPAKNGQAQPPRPLAKAEPIWVKFSALVLSEDNVRTKSTVTGIEELAALIRAQGLLNPLQVSIQLADGMPTGFYEVEAGGRRLRALAFLVKNGDLSPDELIECRLCEKTQSTQISCAENSGRQDMHPADAFDAFRKMADQGLAHEEIAAKFGQTVATVKRRLKLANVAPQLLTLYRQGKATLDQMQALASSDDQERQLAVWNGLDTYNRQPHTLKSRLTIDELSTDDARVKLVGLKAYKAEGGTVREDLFSSSGERYVTDIALLELLLAERLELEAQPVRAEGWLWVETREQFDYADRTAYGMLQAGAREFTEQEALALDALRQREEAAITALGVLEAQDSYGGDEYDSLHNELENVEKAIADLHTSARAWQNEQRAQSGAIVTVDESGLRVYRGVVRPEDRKAVDSALRQAGTEGTVKAKPAVSEKLMMALTGHRTGALQAALAGNQSVALALLAHRLACSTFGEFDAGVLKISATLCRHKLDSLAVGFEKSRAALELDAAQALWTEKLPQDSSLWLDWLLAQPLDVVLALITFCTALTVDTVHSRETGDSHSDRLAQALSLDMADYWEATAETYLGAVPKAKLAEAVAEAAGAESAASIAGMKKADAIVYAAQQLAGKRWLPVALRGRVEEGEVSA